KSFEGFKTRIVSKITSLTIIQVINKFIFGRNENNIKINIA
ncbi:MAG TPA: IS982 family transposase, partial [Bacteroidales bacterium]